MLLMMFMLFSMLCSARAIGICNYHERYWLAFINFILLLVTTSLFTIEVIRYVTS